MPPAATVEADVLKNSGSCYEVNPCLCPKAALAFLATFKVLGVFLSHKGKRIVFLKPVCLSVSAYTLVRLRDNLGIPLGGRQGQSARATGIVLGEGSGSATSLALMKAISPRLEGHLHDPPLERRLAGCCRSGHLSTP